MSQKWQRSKQWDDENIPPALWPVKALLRAFSSITLAVFLLSGVIVFAILASVPIGLLALIPTVIVYILTFLLTIALVAGLPTLGVGRVLRGAGAGSRFVALFASLVALSALGAWLWATQLWPVIRYDAAHGTGLRLFASFVEAHKSTTLRRLPGFEMSELEFYSWWPMRLLLLAFVANMITATVRRIEFSFPYIGVLTVHTGIVIMALGSLYYKALKKEGDTLMMAGQPAADGAPTPGPAQNIFYDNTHVALWMDMGRGWEARPLRVPRYNDYNLDAGSEGSLAKVLDARSKPLPERSIDRRVSDSPNNIIDPDLTFRIVGYASYAASIDDWIPAAPPAGADANPVRFMDLVSRLPDASGRVSDDAAFRFAFMPRTPSWRISEVGSDESPVMTVEYTLGMDERRWADLATSLPEGAMHGLIVEAGGERAVYAARPGDQFTIAGYTIAVEQILPRPPFPIITPGYRGASSSVAIVHVTPTEGEAFDRWLYHRFPEIDQDMLDETGPGGMQKRRGADPSIRISFIDASRLQVYIDEPAAGGPCRAIVRPRAGAPRVVESFDPAAPLEAVEKIILRPAERWAHAEPLERPQSVPEQERDKSLVGTHDKAMLAVAVSPRDGSWTRTLWLPFTRYLNVGLGTERSILLPDGRPLRLAFGRWAHQLPGFVVQLLDFQMLAYDHRGAPRDYQSLIRVMPASFENFEPYDHVTKLNAPLQAPFLWSESRSLPANVFGKLASRLNPRQFKFSQSGWDADGWRQTQAAADRGEIPRPFASYTILGVGNNPGIHIIALGGILVSIGTPWAFYVKPWLMRRRRRKIQEELAREQNEPAEAVGAQA